MSKKKEAPAKNKKKELREQIASQLVTTFAGIKEAIGDKKFNRQVKKASKILAAGAVRKSEKSKLTAEPAV